MISARLLSALAARNARASSDGAGANFVRAGAFASTRPSAPYTYRSRSKCCAIVASRCGIVPARSAAETSFAASVALCTASCSAWTRNASSERDENCETTIAVETAATSAKAAPSHQRTPMKRLVMSTGYAVSVRTVSTALRRLGPAQAPPSRRASAGDEPEPPTTSAMPSGNARRSSASRVLAQRDAEPEQLRRQPSCEGHRVGDRRVGAEIHDLPAVAAQGDRGRHQAELVLLARRAKEHRAAAHAAARVAEQVPEPGADGLAHEMLLRHRQLAARPALADRLEQRPDDRLECLVDAEQRERLVEPQPDLRRLAERDRVEHPAQVIARRPPDSTPIVPRSDAATPIR